jgi:exonuclease III
MDVHLSPANLLSNTFWGDELTCKAPNTFRIYCQNANGLRLDQRGGDFATICSLANEVQADVIGITEHNLDTTKFAVRKLCHDARTHIQPHSSLTMGSSPFEMTNYYKPGGTLTMSCGKISARLLRTGSDSMGRWTYQTYSGKRACNVTIITAYQVCTKSTTQRGRYTAAAQQESLLRQRGKQNPNPRTHFCKDLTTFLKQRRQEGDELILLGDFNEALGDESNGISKICGAIGMVDIMHSLHDSHQVATYARGRKRLDYALATPRTAKTITYGGYEPFNHRFVSDHRAFFLDFDEAALFGSESPSLPPLHKRDLHAKSPKEVTKYLEAKYDLLAQRNLFNQVTELCKAPHPNHELAEQIDQDLHCLSIAAAKQCQKFREPVWSIKLNAARARVGILKCLLSIRGTRYDQNEQIEQLRTSQGPSFTLPSTIEECKQQLRQAQAEVSQIAQESIQHRDDENLARVADLELEGDKKKALILRNLRKAEEMRRMFAKIRYLRSPHQGSGVSSIQVPAQPTDNPKDCSDWITVDAPAEVVEKLRDRNRKHFGQAHGTPFTIPPLSEDLDFTGATSSADMILEGTYDASALADITQLVISKMSESKYSIRAPLDTDISEEAYVSKIKSWKESTSTSPSGLHLGHYHAMIARHEFSGLKDSPEKDDLDSKQSAIRRAHLGLTNYALRHGYSFERWRTVVNVMLQK